VSLHGKFPLGLAFLIITGAQVQAQGGPPTDYSKSPRPGSMCRDIAVVVTDSFGSAIIGADVATEDSALRLTTDSQGIAAIPCHTVPPVFPVVTVTANGYQPTRVSLAPDARSRLEIRLDKTEPIISSGTTVNASELSANVQKQSEQLQQRAEKALAAEDYENAERLLLDALHLTPSSAPVANNLGVVALHRKDLDTAGSWFQKASDEAPYRPDILGNLGLVRWMQQRTKESYEILVKAFSRGYESNLGHYILGLVGLERGNSKEAADHLKKVSPDRYPYRDLYLSIALRNCGKNKAAGETYQSFLRRNPATFLISDLR
jgi:hypothetical protein